MLIRFDSNLNIDEIKIITKPNTRKNSKTLPRGFTIGPGSETSGESVFGLYGDLMNVEEYEVS